MNQWKINRLKHQKELIREEISKKYKEIKELQVEGMKISDELWRLKRGLDK